LQAEILATLWRLGRATVRDVQRQLPAAYQHGYGTIRSAMQRLAADGYITRLPRKQRNAYVYVAGLSREALTTQLLHQILEGLAADYPSAVAAFVARNDRARAPHLRLVWRADHPQQYVGS
jgi:predicted transcriptional regulator